MEIYKTSEKAVLSKCYTAKLNDVTLLGLCTDILCTALIDIQIFSQKRSDL